MDLRYLDTGAMYRAMTWWMLRHGIDVDDAAAVAAACDKPTLVSGTEPMAPAISVDGEDASAPIRTREVTNAVSAVSAVPAVRTRLVALQRETIGGGGIVVDGRDIGTTVAPDAPVKVFLTASAAARAARRTAELSHDAQATLARMQSEMQRRDQLDSARAVSPLAMADDAIELDTTDLNLDEVIEAVVGLVREKLGS